MSLSEFLRTLPVVDEWHDDSGGDNDDALDAGRPARKRFKALGLSINDDSFTVPGIHERPLPREDGYGEDAAEPWIARSRPYNREYLNEREERERILSSDPQYRFIRTIAGALRKKPVDVADEEDLSRVMRERATERRVDELERQRTLVSMREKTDMIARLNSLVEQVRARHTRMLTQRPGDGLMDLARDLMGEGSPVRFTAVQHWLAEYELVQSINGDRRNDAYVAEIARVEEFVQGDVDTADGLDALQRAMRRLATPMRQYLLYFFFLFHRDFLDLDGAPMLYARVTRCKNYVTRMALSLDIRESSDAVGKVVLPPLLADPSDWGTRHAGAELIDMGYFQALQLSNETERAIVQRVPSSVYSARALVTLMDFAYNGNAMELDTVLRDAQYARIRPLLWRANTNDDGEALRLDEAKARLLVRAHLLWLYFDEHDLDDFVTLLYRDQAELSRVSKNMVDLLTQALEVLRKMRDAYVPLVEEYLTQVARHLRGVKTVADASVLAFRVEDQPVRLGEQELYRAGDRADAMVQDALFRRYLREGKRVFGETTSATASEGPLLREAPPLEYPALVLHILFEQYVRFLDEYALYAERELAQGETALEKARAKVASMLGDERVERADRDDPLQYRQRKAWVTQPVNSGFVKLNAEVWALVKLCYHDVQQACAALRGLPLEAFHSEQAFASGLTDAFAALVAAKYSYNDLSINMQYNSLQHTKHVHKTLKEAWLRMHRFSAAMFGTTYLVSGGTPQPGWTQQQAPRLNFTLGAM